MPIVYLVFNCALLNVEFLSSRRLNYVRTGDFVTAWPCFRGERVFVAKGDIERPPNSIIVIFYYYMHSE